MTAPTAERVAVPGPVLNRLPVYLRAAARLEASGDTVVSSLQLGRLLDMNPARIRKDLSCIGHLGRQGHGYHVTALLESLQRALGVDHEWPVVVVGVGRLGYGMLALLSFAATRFRVTRAFDDDPLLIGQRVGDAVVEDVATLETALRAESIELAIVAVAEEANQAVVDALVAQGVRAIVDFGPIAAHVPDGVQVQQVDPSLVLQSMTYHLIQPSRPRMGVERAAVGPSNADRQAAAR